MGVVALCCRLCVVKRDGSCGSGLCEGGNGDRLLYSSVVLSAEGLELLEIQCDMGEAREERSASVARWVDGVTEAGKEEKQKEKEMSVSAASLVQCNNQFEIAWYSDSIMTALGSELTRPTSLK